MALIGAHLINKGAFDADICRRIHEAGELIPGSNTMYGAGVYAYYVDRVPTACRGKPLVIFEPLTRQARVARIDIYIPGMYVPGQFSTPDHCFFVLPGPTSVPTKGCPVGVCELPRVATISRNSLSCVAHAENFHFNRENMAMFFPTFACEPLPTSLPKELIFTVEHLVSHMLATADSDFLSQAVRERQLTNILFDELSFLGAIPVPYAQAVRAYLTAHEPSLVSTAQYMLFKPSDAMFQQELCSPHIAEKA